MHFNQFQRGGNSASVSIGKMLTVMSEQDNTIRILSRILGREYNEQHLHDIHDLLFGNLYNQVVPTIGMAYISPVC